MKDCIYCQKKPLEQFTLKITELKSSTVYLNLNNTYPGRCIVALKEHQQELFQLDKDQLFNFINDVARVAQSIKIATGADKINYAVFGDVVSHLHFHLVPKTKNGPQWGNYFNDTSQNPQTLTTQQAEELKRQILKYLT